MEIKCPKCNSTNIEWKNKTQEWKCRKCKTSFKFKGEPPSDPLENRALNYANEALAESDVVWVKEIFEKWPGPLAYTYHLLNELLKDAKIDAAALVFKDFVELLIRFTGLCMAKDIIENSNNEKKNTVLKDLFDKPMTMGSWLNFADKCAKFEYEYSENLKFKELRSFWRKNKKKQTNMHEIVDKVVHWRNETIGHGVRGNDVQKILDELKKYLGDGKESINIALKQYADFWDDILLEALLTDGKKSIMGYESVNPKLNCNDNKAVLAPISLVRKSSNDKLSLDPYFSGRCCKMCSNPNLNVFIYDSVRRKKDLPQFKLMEYELGHYFMVSDDSLIKKYSAIKGYEKDVSYEENDFEQDVLSQDLDNWLKDLLLEKNYISPKFLRDWLKKSVNHKKKLLWLQSPAHIGKTTFIQGIDHSYSLDKKLFDDFAVAVFYIKREYNYHLAQFTDGLLFKIKDEYGLVPQNKPLPKLDDSNPSPDSLVTFLKEFQVLGKKPLLLVIDGLDELAEENPSIADYIPTSKDILDKLPENISILLTSRPNEELPDWLKQKIKGLESISEIKKVGLEDEDYIKLMKTYAKNKIKNKIKNLKNDELNSLLDKMLEKSGGIFLYFSFLVERLSSGEISPDDINKLTDPDKLIPNYIKSLLNLYSNTPQGDILKRILIYLSVQEETFIKHNLNLSVLAQSEWQGIPLKTLSLAIEGQPYVTPRLAISLYMLKPLLGTWHGGKDSSYRLGIKGLNEIIRNKYDKDINYVEDITSLHDHLVTGLLDEKTDYENLDDDIYWTATHLDGHEGYLPESVSKKLKDGSYTDNLMNLVDELMKRARELYGESLYQEGLSYYAVIEYILNCINSNNEKLSDIYFKNERLFNYYIDLFINKSNLLLYIGDQKGAIKEYDNAIEIWEALKDKLKDNFTPDMVDSLANVYNIKAKALSISGDTNAAIKECNKAIDILENLQNTSKYNFIPDIAENLANLYYNKSSILLLLGDKKLALSEFDKIINICKKFEESQDGLTINMVHIRAKVYISKSNISGDNDAIKECDNAIEILEDLKDKLKDNFTTDMTSDLATAHMNKGNTLSDLKNQKGAIKECDNAIEILEDLKDKLKDNFTPDMASALATAHMNKGNTLSDLKNQKGAIKEYDNAIEILETLKDKLKDKLKDNFTTNMTSDLATVHINKGNELLSKGDQNGAIKEYDNAIEILEDLKDKLKDNFTPSMAYNLALSYMYKGAVLFFGLGKIQLAREEYDKATKIFEDLRNRLGDNFTPDTAYNLALSYMNKGNVLSGLGENQLSIEEYDKAIKICKYFKNHSNSNIADNFSKLLSMLQKLIKN